MAIEAFDMYSAGSHAQAFRKLTNCSDTTFYATGLGATSEKYQALINDYYQWRDVNEGAAGMWLAGSTVVLYQYSSQLGISWLRGGAGSTAGIAIDLEPGEREI